jgi:uncharacterized protein involved in exopolysaccharide biosynthesis
MTTPSQSTVFFRAFAVMFILVFTMSAAVTWLLPEKYAGTCRMKGVLCEPDIPPPYLKPGDIGAYDLFLRGRLIEILQSPAVLTNVIEKLDLNNRWGQRYDGGRVWTTRKSLALIGHDLDLGSVPNKNIITITFYSQDKSEAAEIANAIAQAYEDHVAKVVKQMRIAGLAHLLEQALENEDKIQAASTNLENLRAKLKIQENDPNTANPLQNSEQMLQVYNQQVIEQQRVYKSLETQLNDLKAMTTRTLREVLPTVTEDNLLIDLLGKLHTAQQQYNTVTNIYAPTNSESIRIQATIQKLNHEIDDRVAAILLALESEVKSKKANITGLIAAVEKAKADDQQELERGKPYWDAKRQYEQLLDFQKALTNKIEYVKQEIKHPTASWVLITDPAVPGQAPVKPNKPLCLVEGGITGMLLGVLSGFMAVRLGRKI